MHKAKRRTGKKIWIAAAVLVCLAAALAAVFLVWRSNTCTVHFLMPDGSQVRERLRRGGTLDRLPEDPVREGYAFLGWEDENGTLLSGAGAVFQEDARYSPRFMPALNTDPEVHEPYLFPDENGFLLPGAPFTRREAALLLLPSLPQDIEPEAEFEDLTGDEDCARAAGVLQALGLVPGGAFRPEDALTLRELLSMTAPFFSPEETDSAELPDWLAENDPDSALFLTAWSLGWLEGFEEGTDPDAPLSRGEAAALLNRILNRSVQLIELREHVGAFPDVSPLHPYYADLMEAAIPHSRRLAGGREVWTASEPTGRLPEGMLFLNDNTYYVNSDGYLLTGGQLGGLTFDEQGAYTSGDAELDQMTREIVRKVTKDGMEPLDRLRAVYLYCRDSLTYVPREILGYRDTGWEIEKAKETLSTGMGNCYGFASAFWALARQLGYDAQAFSGVVAYDRDPHGFVTIEIGRKNYLFDPELEASRKLQGIEEDRFMLDPDSPLAEDWAYRPITKTLT